VLGVLLYKKISQLLTSAEHTVSELTPKLGRTLDEATGELSDLRTLTQNVGAVVGDVQALSGTVRQGVELVQAVRRPKALWAGIRAGASVLARSFAPKDGKGDHHGS
jgi:ABC-type transporter Mla subunit MlaD